MIAGLNQAKGELIAFADSDIRPDKKALKSLVETLLSRPDAGAAFAPVVATSSHRSVGDAGYALLINGMYGAAAASAALENGGELPFIMGQFMVFKRSTIEAIGGLESAEGQLVDDMYIGARVSAAGLRNLVSPRRVPIIQQGLSFGEFLATFRRWILFSRRVPIIQQGLSFGEFLATFRRWILFSRTGLPGWAFKRINIMHGLIFWLGLLASLVALVNGYWLAAALNALAALGISASINALHGTLGGAPLASRHLWASFGLILGAPLIYLSIFFKQQVNWRGRSYQLNAQSRLAQGQPLEADERRKDEQVQPQGAA
jgi:ceramide glucosyltransferase